MSQNYYDEAVKIWNIESLLTDLQNKAEKKYTNSSRKEILCALLCNYDLKQISIGLSYPTVREYASQIYRDIEFLTNTQASTIKSTNIIKILRDHGYAKGEESSKHNLPARSYSQFIGREQEMKKILEYLDHNHAAHIITIDGIGGVGKTTLALEAAYLCLEATRNHVYDKPHFEAFVFTSAKIQSLDSDGIRQELNPHRSLGDIFRAIYMTFTDSEIMQVPHKDQINHIRNILSKQNTLIIVDNIDTVEDLEEVKSFLYYLPANVKVLITSREKFTFLPISLNCLSMDESIKLIRQQAQEKQIDLTTQDIEHLCIVTGGLPLAIVYAVGRLAACHRIDFVLERVGSAEGDPARFMFQRSVEEMQGKAAHKLLMARAIFSDPPTQSSLVEVSGLTDSPHDIDEALAYLERLSFLSLKQTSRRYEMLSFTRQYALVQLSKHKDFEQQARERWVSFYLDFANKHGGEDWIQWSGYAELEKEILNLHAVLDWCKEQNDYDKVKELVLLLNHYASLYGRWPQYLDWLDWLVLQSKNRGDWSTVIKVVIAKSWLLMRSWSVQDLEETPKLLMEVWEIRKHADKQTQADLAESIARLWIKKEDHQSAQKFLNDEEIIVINADFSEDLHIRYYIPILYHRAVIHYRKQDYALARGGFSAVLENANKIQWHRVISSSKNWLADIAIEENDRDTAKRLITEGLMMTENNPIQRRRFARYQRSRARWEKKWGILEESRRYAEQAIDNFERLGMIKEKEAMQDFINGLNN